MQPDQSIGSEGMVRPESLRREAARLERFANSVASLTSEMGMKSFDHKKMKEVVAGISDDEAASAALGKVVERYSQIRQEVDAQWQFVKAGRDLDNWENVSPNLASDAYWMLTGNDPVGEVRVKRTDMTIHIQCGDEADFDRMIQTEMDLKGMRMEMSGKAAGAFFDKLKFPGANGERPDIPGYVTAALGFEDEYNGQNTMRHERKHGENAVFRDAGCFSLARRFGGTAKPGSELANLPVVDTTFKALMTTSFAQIEVVGMDTALRMGHGDFLLADELYARTDGKEGEYQDTDSLVNELDQGYYLGLPIMYNSLEKYGDTLAKMLAASGGDSQVVDRFIEVSEKYLEKEFLPTRSVRARQAVTVFNNLVGLYGDPATVQGLLMPFFVKQWPAVERVLRKYGSKASK